MKRILLSGILVTGFAFTTNAQNVNIPDMNFKMALLNYNPVIDTNGDGEIQVSEAQAFTGVMNVSNKNITDLTGIEAFTALTGLGCSSNQLTSLDISNNTALTSLGCSYNQLTSLDVSNNTALTELWCNNNQLTSLDISNNTALMELYCFNNQLTSLDVSNNTALTHLFCHYTQLTSLDVSNNTALTELNCSNTQLTSLDVSNNTALTWLSCYNTQLTSLDVSNNTVLTDLYCSNSQLTSLNVANSNNTNFITLWAQNNPNLTCIQVDDAAYSNENWEGNYFNKDSGVVWSEECIVSVDVMEQSFTKVYPNPTTNILNIDISSSLNITENTKITIVDITGKTLTAQTLQTGSNTIDVSGFTNGVYFIKNEKGGVVKFVKK